MRTLKQYNKMSTKQVQNELVEIIEQKNNGEGNNIQMEYSLKSNLLYFKTTLAEQMTAENQMNIYKKTRL